MKLTDWIAKRHDRYAKFMIRIQRFIAAILGAEKEERKKDKQVNKALIGHDPEKWLKSSVKIRKEEQHDHTYTKLDLPPAVKESTSTASAKHCTKRCTLSWINGSGPMPIRRES